MMHGWQFELATGCCLSSDHHRLYAQPITREETATDASGGSEASAGSNGRELINDTVDQLRMHARTAGTSHRDGQNLPKGIWAHEY
jgi:hypothetical protein